MRHYLEYKTFILADNLRALIDFSGDGHYDLGNRMPHVLKRCRKLLEDGEKSAMKWRLDDEKNEIAATRATVKDFVAKTSAEQWAINPSVHFNEWANLQGSEFQEVVDAFKNLLKHLRCENTVCKSYLYVTPCKGQSEDK